MIDPGGIPQITGDMGLLGEHARSIGDVGTAFPDTGSRVHDGWQALATCYTAPEAESLFAATGPVATVSASVGEDLAAVAGALTAYADEVAVIQARLATLQTQALDFVGGPGAAPGWGDDQGLLDRHDQLLSEVNAAVADFGDAERRCANTIMALHTDRRYVADDGDGVVDPDEHRPGRAQPLPRPGDPARRPAPHRPSARPPRLAADGGAAGRSARRGSDDQRRALRGRRSARRGDRGRPARPAGRARWARDTGGSGGGRVR